MEMDTGSGEADGDCHWTEKWSQLRETRGAILRKHAARRQNGSLHSLHLAGDSTPGSQVRGAKRGRSRKKKTTFLVTVDFGV